jgi:hypothetical protein
VPTILARVIANVGGTRRCRAMPPHARHQAAVVQLPGDGALGGAGVPVPEGGGGIGVDSCTLAARVWQGVFCVVCCVLCVVCVVCCVCGCVCGCVCLCVCVGGVSVFVFCSALFYVVRVEAVDVRGWSPMHR